MSPAHFFVYVLVQLHLVKVLFGTLPKCLFPLVLEAFQRGQRSSQLAALPLNTSFFVLLFSTTHRQFSGCTRIHWLSVDQVYWTNLRCTGRVLSCGMEIFHLKQQTPHSPNDLSRADTTCISCQHMTHLIYMCNFSGFYSFSSAKKWSGTHLYIDVLHVCLFFKSIHIIIIIIIIMLHFTSQTVNKGVRQGWSRYI